MSDSTPSLKYLRGALRSKLVSKLTGLSVPTLQHWHASTLQEASKEAGDRGVARLYSWVNYQRLCVMATLKDEGVPTTRIREAVQFLDAMFPGWWRMSLRAYEGRVRGSQSRVHVALRANLDVIADVPGGQMSFREAMREESEDISTSVASALVTLEQRGPLFRQHAFEDAVSMSPELNAAQPTVRGTSLETHFLAALVDRMGESEVARIYRLDQWKLSRAVSFERAA